MYDFLAVTENRPRRVFEPVFADVSVDQYALRMTVKDYYADARELYKEVVKRACENCQEFDCHGCEFSVYKKKRTASDFLKTVDDAIKEVSI